MRSSWKSALTIAACIVLVTAGCSSDTTGSPAADDTTAATTSASGTRAAKTSAAETDGAGSADAVDRTVDKTGWFGGFAITVDDVTATPQGGGAKVDVKLSYENLVGEALTPPDKAYLEVSGGEVVDISFNNPKIAGFGKGKGKATATVSSSDSSDPDEILDTVVLVYGEADGNLTKIPFSEDGKVESVEPRGITVGQTFGEEVTTTLTKAFLWPSYQPGEKEKYELWVEVTVACGTECGAGYQVTPGSFSVTSPDGRRVVGDERSTLKSEILGNGDSFEGKWVIFLIDSPAKGNYKLDVIPDGLTIEKTEASTTITL